MLSLGMLPFGLRGLLVIFINNDNVTESKDVYLTSLCFQWFWFVCSVVLVCVFCGPLFCIILT